MDVPNEITLAQLVSHVIIPAGDDQLGADTVFFWSLGVIPDPKSMDKTRSKVVEIPAIIPTGFNLRGMANTLHENMDGRKQVTCSFGTAQVRFTLHEGETIGKLATMAVGWMVHVVKEINGLLKEIRTGWLILTIATQSSRSPKLKKLQFI